MTDTQIKMMKNKEVVTDIEDFIKNFNGTQDNFLNGNCYWFAVILIERFRFFYKVDIAYNQIQNHFAMVVTIYYSDKTTNQFLFDASGLIGPMVEGDGWKLWREYYSYEPTDAARVYRDCIWKMSEEKWSKLKRFYKKEPWMLPRDAVRY